MKYKTRRFLLLLALVCDGAFSSRCMGEDQLGSIPDRAQVEAQPLGSNARRLISTMQLLGTPLADSSIKGLMNSIESGDADQIQQQLDPLVLFVVQINPEERVKVRRGPAKLTLQQFGFTPFLIKILNDSTVTKPLRIVSPQAGAVYAGVAKLSMQRQQSLELIENENRQRDKQRFLAVELFQQPPMSDRLSGLEVEYAVGLILSTESGRREVTIGFDLGQQEQDLGFRGEIPVLFSIRPAVPIQLSIRDEDDSPTTASLIIRDRQGHVYPPQAKRLAPDFFFQPQIYRADGERLLLPPGEFTVQSGRGPEYLTREQVLTVTETTSAPNEANLDRPAEQRLEIRLLKLRIELRVAADEEAAQAVNEAASDIRSTKHAFVRDYLRKY